MAIWIGFSFLILVVLGGCTLAQPVLTPQGHSVHLADPARLERHVRTLSESFVPRDWLHPENLDRVAYTLEEPPFFRSRKMGSAQHAMALRSRGARVRGVLVLEMIGFFSDARGSQGYPMPIMRAFYPSRGNFIAVVSNFGSLGLTRRVKKAMTAARELPVRSMNAPAFIPGVDFSDHHPYWEAGYDAVMITDGAFNRNRAYHTPGDTADRLDYRRMAKVVEGVLEAVCRMDQN